MTLIKRRMLGALAASILVATAASAALSDGSGSTTSTHRAPAAKATAKPAPKAAAKSATQKQPITISITSHITHGNLVVILDDVPVFNEEFKKPPFLISQTTTWDPIQVSPGKHKLTAKVYSTKGKTYLSGVYDLEVSHTKGIELRVKMSGDKLTVEPAS
ncbi:MAG TPA: hypothetical protein VFV19_07610 [Candidatus Polarisedimenticolaceae bacterium]|nr:hypothetical protein [Candidatus Polarisedimenticolaceae bacterium]